MTAVTAFQIKSEITQDALKRKDSKLGGGLRMPLDYATLSSAVHVERAMYFKAATLFDSSIISPNLCYCIIFCLSIYPSIFF